MTVTTKQIKDLTNLGTFMEGDKVVGERIDGTTVRLTLNGIVIDGDFTANGICARTAAGTYTNRTITGTTDSITVTNGDGVSGNPTLTISSTYPGQTSITTLGTINSASIPSQFITGTASRAAVFGGAGALTASSVTATELGYLSGVTSALQTQINGINTTLSSGPISANIISSFPTISRAAVFGGAGALTASSVTATELGYVAGTSSNIQLQLDGKSSVIGNSSINTVGTITSGTWNGTTIAVPNGGSNRTSATAYAPICGGTTSTGAHQSASTGQSTSGFVLTSTGSSSLPTFQAPNTLRGIMVSRSGNQSISASTFTKVQLDTKAFDTNTEFDATTNYRWTPLKAGYYLVTGTIYCSSLALNKLVYATIYKNGSALISNLAYSGGSDTTAQVTTLVSMNGSTDYLELFTFQSDTVSRNISSLSRIAGCLVGV